MARQNEMHEINSLYGRSNTSQLRCDAVRREKAVRSADGQEVGAKGPAEPVQASQQKALSAQGRPRQRVAQATQSQAQQHDSQPSQQRVRPAQGQTPQRASQGQRSQGRRPNGQQQRAQAQRPQGQAQRPSPRPAQGQTSQNPRSQGQRPQGQSPQRQRPQGQRPLAQGQRPRAQQQRRPRPQATSEQQRASQAARVRPQRQASARPSATAARVSELSTRILPTIFLAVIAVLLVLGIALPDSSYSETEKRNLQTLPTLTLSTFTDGSFQESFQTYVEDQFPLRDTWVTIHSIVATWMGRVENNGVYRCDDGTLILGFVEPEDNSAAQSIVDFSQSHPDLKVCTMIAPTAAGINADNLPSQVVMPDQKAYLTSINSQFAAAGNQVVDLWSTFEAKKSEDLYYRTDHHWTTYGAKVAYNSLASALGIDVSSKTYDDLVVSTDFQGSLSAEGGYLDSGSEDLHVYLRNDQDIPCIVTYTSEKTKSASPYVSSKLDTRDAYQVFFGGNHALIQIDSYAENSLGTLLVVKDSYANSLIPFLIGDYERIIVVDPRYYTGTLESLISSNNVSQVLFLYNATTFAQDTSLRRLVDAGAEQMAAEAALEAAAEEAAEETADEA